MRHFALGNPKASEYWNLHQSKTNVKASAAASVPATVKTHIADPLRRR
jgi:hypothetical protein